MRPTALLSVALVLIAAVLSASAVPSLAGKFPEPSVYPIAWQLDYKQAMPKRIVVDTTPYWYITYTVTNNTGQEQTWRPDFEMLTNEGKIVRSDRNIPADVFDRIKAREGNKLLETASVVAGPLRQGAGQAKDGVAIWKEPAARMGKFKVFVGGLRGEFVILKDEDGKPQMGPDKLPLILRKTYEADYAIYGDEFYPGRDDVHELKHTWVMR
jgi:hypothetical protein